MAFLPSRDPRLPDVPMDPVRAMPFSKSAMMCIGLSWKRYRKKLPRTYACDCGWRFRWTCWEQAPSHWNEVQELICFDCGAVNRVFAGTRVHIVHNPLGHHTYPSAKDGGWSKPGELSVQLTTGNN